MSTTAPPPTKVDRRRELKHLYTASADTPTIVDVPELPFLMIDGHGDPNLSAAYREGMAALFAVSYALKFALKRASGVDHAVMPPEGLWWVEPPARFSLDDKASWSWTVMLGQPEPVTPELVAEAAAAAAKKKPLPAAGRLRLERFREGPAAQILHVGPYEDEPPTVERLDAFIVAEGYERTGKHHEIYLTDPSRTAPEKLKTLIRHPIRRPG
jgi:hypothetical protein